MMSEFTLFCLLYLGVHLIFTLINLNIWSINSLVIFIIIILTISVLSQTLIIKSQPYDSKMTNMVPFINELAVSVYLYLSLLLSDFV